MKILALQSGDNLIRHWARWYRVEPLTNAPLVKLVKGKFNE